MPANRYRHLKLLPGVNIMRSFQNSNMIRLFEIFMSRLYTMLSFVQGDFLYIQRWVII